jgi:hypothetical protein
MRLDCSLDNPSAALNSRSYVSTLATPRPRRVAGHAQRPGRGGGLAPFLPIQVAYPPNFNSDDDDHHFSNVNL